MSAVLQSPAAEATRNVAPDGPLVAAVREAIAGSSREQLLWLSGYLAGLAAQPGEAGAFVAAPASAAADQPVATVLYATHTGNGRRIAEQLAAQAEAKGYRVRLVAASDYSAKELAAETRLFAVVSTHGDGDPPDAARALFDGLKGKRAPALPSLRFSVLALGDSSYPKYCEAGRWLDERLAELGAARVADRIDSDVDYAGAASAWHQLALDEFAKAAPAATAARAPRLHSVPAHDRDRPFAAAVLANQRITARESTRDIRHVELSLAGSGLQYLPGDSLGLWPTNPAATVTALLDVLGASADTLVRRGDTELPLGVWLADRLEITRLSKPLLAAQAERTRDPELAARLADPAKLRATLRDWQPVDLLRRFPAGWTAAELVALLRPLTPRLYSIASSQLAVGDEAHLTVGVQSNGEADWLGAASGWLSTRVADEHDVPVYIEPNDHFRLPTDGSRDVLMIGPGTGVAPFRAFVQHRAATGARGRQWLFFGARHFRSEFLYQLEWQTALRKGQLTRLDVAFSRDRAEKFYVQHRLREHARDVYAWLEGGASLYVCGDADHMAPDVEAALVDIVATAGGRSVEQAHEYLASLKAAGRYQRDVY